MGNQDAMWEEFNLWHRERYGWDMRDDRARGSHDGYTGMVAWYAWCEATKRAMPNVEIRGSEAVPID